MRDRAAGGAVPTDDAGRPDGRRPRQSHTGSHGNDDNGVTDDARLPLHRLSAAPPAASPATDDRHWLLRAYGPLWDGRTWAATLHLLINLALGIAFFTAAVTMLSVSAGLLITLVGIPLLVATVGDGAGDRRDRTRSGPGTAR